MLRNKLVVRQRLLPVLLPLRHLEVALIVVDRGPVLLGRRRVGGQQQMLILTRLLGFCRGIIQVQHHIRFGAGQHCFRGIVGLLACALDRSINSS